MSIIVVFCLVFSCLSSHPPRFLFPLCLLDVLHPLLGDLTPPSDSLGYVIGWLCVKGGALLVLCCFSSSKIVLHRQFRLQPSDIAGPTKCRLKRVGSCNCWLITPNSTTTTRWTYSPAEELSNLSSRNGIKEFVAGFASPVRAFFVFTPRRSYRWAAAPPCETTGNSFENREPRKYPSRQPPLRRGSPQLSRPMRGEDESRAGSSDAGGRDSLFRKRGDAWALRAPGGGPLLRIAIWRTNNMQAPHPTRAPVLQEPASGHEEVHPPV